ncbi:hypothetical protein [Fodinibius sp. AD559]|uniref:hypothetical protein n=1 Tax=Fodinibius sp. AD559 TaxID=3424179 RepID=UPI004046E700
MDLKYRLENVEQTLAAIKQIDPAKGRNIMMNYDELINDFHQLVVKDKSISLLLEKGKKHYLNEKEILEMNVLFSAYCKIKARNLSNEDLKATTLVDYTTGNPLTLEGIEQRLTTLGWEG